MLLELKQLKIDGGTQPRVAIHEETVAEYTEALRDGVSFPPVVAFHEGACWWLADGFHRYFAHRRAGLEKIEVDVREGTLRDAILFSVGANTEHGVRRTNEDKRKAVETLLTNETVSTNDEGKPWSDREIARQCKISHPFAAKMRSSIDASHTGNVSSIEREGSAERQFIHPKTGRPATMDTANIRRSNKARREPVRIARDAYRPRPHSEDSRVPMRTISLPLNNPHQAAMGLLSVFGEDYVRRLVAELNLFFQNQEGAEHDPHGQ